MSDLIKTLKQFGLTEFYFSLPIQDKADMAGYSATLICVPQNTLNCRPECNECFMVHNGSQFLWATAANAIPDRKYRFAEKLLTHALSITIETDDLAWIHANLAQVYFDNHKSDPDAGKKSILHCRELIKMGYMKIWARNMMEELTVFQ